MDLAIRPLRAEDMEFVVHNTRDTFAYSEEERTSLRTLLQTLFLQHAAWGEMLEDRSLSAEEPQEVYYFFFFCVTDEFAQRAKTELPPFLCKYLLSQRQNLYQTTCLDAREITAANSADGAGLNIFSISGGPAILLDFPNQTEVISRFPEWVLSAAGGFNLKEVFFEAFGDVQRDWAISAGLLLRTDYSEYSQNGTDKPTASDCHPFLFSLNRLEARDAIYGSLYARLFYYVPPVYYFRRTEQEVLLHALLGYTDAQIARRLSVSLSTIHKRWKSIYDRVKSVPSSALVPDPQAAPRTTRGSEMKSHLLDYVRRHPEELRPANPPETP